MESSVPLKNNVDAVLAYTAEQDHDQVKQANATALQVLDVICEAIKPGVKESEILDYCSQVYKDFNVDRIWHQPLVRFGEHTTLTYLDQTSSDRSLGEMDIAFVDIGIVIDGIEGDVGKTLVFGEHEGYQALAADTEIIFEKARDYWLENSPTGIELYQFVNDLAHSKGYACPLEQAGHLIGRFAHAQTRWTLGMSQYPEVVLPNHWILEIQIKHQDLPYGGFYEQLLSDQL